MSRFFSDLEEEKKEYKKKFNIPQKQVEKISKKEKIQIEFDTRVNELIKNPKNIKKFISDLKKYDGVEIKRNVEEWFLSDKIYQKSNKKLIDDFLYKDDTNSNIIGNSKDDDNTSININIIDNSKYNDTNSNIVGNSKYNDTNSNINKDDYDVIFNIKDKKLRISKMNDLLMETSSTNTKINIYIHLLSLYVKDNNTNKVYEVFLNIIKYKNDYKVKNLLDNNINFYLDLFIEDIEKYKICLDSIKDIYNDIYIRRYYDLQYNYYCNKIDNNNVFVRDIKIIDLIRHNKSEESLNEFILIDFNLKYDNIFLKNIKEYAEYLFINKKYYESYTCHKYIKNYENNKISLYLLCVLLNKEIQEEDIFKEFLVDFKRFSLNTFALKSKDTIFEIFRSFYHLHCFDGNEVYAIIRSVRKDFEDKEYLENIVNKMIYF